MIRQCPPTRGEGKGVSILSRPILHSYASVLQRACLLLFTTHRRSSKQRPSKDDKLSRELYCVQTLSSYIYKYNIRSIASQMASAFWPPYAILVNGGGKILQFLSSPGYVGEYKYILIGLQFTTLSMLQSYIKQSSTN